ncbi:MAG: hypothetical protein NTY53_26155 [Kiritimatiellaeota bacterium]|nr:hypothetical protein [Kiritimatiellota bacterium]
MKHTRNRFTASLLAALAVMVIGLGNVSAAKKTEPDIVITKDGEKLQAKYAEQLKTLQAEISKALPAVAEHKKAALLKSCDATKAAQQKAEATQKSSGETKNIEAKIANWKKYWLGKANQGIAKAQADLKAATTEAQREAAKKDLAKWQANKADGERNIAEAQAEVVRAKAGQPVQDKTNQAAQAALVQAQANELSAVKALLADFEPFLASDKLDAKLVKCAVLAEATPRGLAAFAQQGPAQAALVEKLLADEKLMKEMLIAGGAEAGKYGQAMQIYSAIQQTSPRARDGELQRLALATALEHAVPVKQNNAETATNAPSIVDPVKRYLHYEKAYLAGELDPAFKHFSAWEYRMVVGCDAPDELLAWGREMLRNYRPDHIYNTDYGWRYSATVKTEVPYGSQNVKNDVPSLQSYQNIIKDGGVCGRRAFFGRFILRSFGIPTWGVTQHAHAALSHWTPKGWVVNLGAGFQWSWWDKGDVPQSGTDFLLETQARAAPQDYLKVLRAQWVNRVLGEQAYNDRKHLAGGFWSSLAHNQAQAIASASKAVALGPLGQELAEANESKAQEKVEPVNLAETDRTLVTGKDGSITIPAVAHSKPTGHFAPMKSFSGGMQVHCSGGFKADYAFDAPHAGKYALTARVVTAQEGQKFEVLANADKASAEIALPYTCGLWQQTKPVELSLVNGKNVMHFSVQDGSRGVTIKDFTLTPVK